MTEKTIYLAEYVIEDRDKILLEAKKIANSDDELQTKSLE